MNANAKALKNNAKQGNHNKNNEKKLKAMKINEIQ